ncbi:MULTISPECIES: helix-turn-helix transcriptional regulator [Flavobacterium]|uniref:helix-turn-helix domain-containing protein n=1 Tax=Flavobacterium TaxID=237 RepID=UPI00136CF07A|nr:MULTISPECIES: helix-turn-helix transcriptional regulator [Flavobacterium]MXO04197.1 helix-turn-helix domain-containing protein [Flavobacterium sp. HBTb2-11-1]URM35857.1 helix-turn-helix domain-containing protein [Flavobacterium anhuiense]
MVNIDDFVKRLESVLEYYGLNASAFADKIGVQRSSMSHLLSGRNKPSLDFVMKILEVFPDVDLYWILIGRGTFPKSNSEEAVETQKSSSPILSNQNVENDLFSGIEINSEQEKREIKKPPVLKNENFSLEDDQIEKIVLFYKNGTFKAYSP